MRFIDELKERILVLDGGFGTTLLQENASVPGMVNDNLNLTNPGLVLEIHDKFLRAGADIISTNTFNANRISLADYDLQEMCYKINYEGALIAKKAAERYENRFVAGSVGPTSVSASLPSNFMNPEERAISFDELKNAYKEQVEGLIDGGADVIIGETFYDGLNAKCLVQACNEVFDEKKVVLPLMLSITINQGGRILSGQTIEEFYHSMRTPNVISVGMNCSFGADIMAPHIKRLAEYSEKYISVHPNAGMPDSQGNYGCSPQEMAEQIRQLVEQGCVNIVGGCCGTTFEHIEEISKAVNGIKPRKPCAGVSMSKHTQISKTANVNENPEFLYCILSDNYEDALDLVCDESAIEICLDHPDIDAEKAMAKFMRLAAVRPDICSIPMIIKSKDFDVIYCAITSAQGRFTVDYSGEGHEEFFKKFGCDLAEGI